MAELCAYADCSRGRIVLRSATRMTELLRLTNLGSEDYRNLRNEQKP